jgi:hypothetical protein
MSRIEIPFSDMPAWVKDESATHVGKNKRPRCYVEVVKDNTAYIGATSSDYARQTIVARRGNGDTRAIRGGYYDSILNHSVEELVGHQGANFTLNKPSDAVLQIYLHYKYSSITMYIRPDSPHIDMVNRLEDGSELTELQANVLRLLADYNSMGRKRERAYNQIPKVLVTVIAYELQEMGLCKVNKAGSITVTADGRRKCRAVGKQSWSWNDWRACHHYVKRNGRVGGAFNGFAGEIVSEYRDRMIAERSRV